MAAGPGGHRAAPASRRRVDGRSPHGPGSLGCPSRQVAAWWGWAAGRTARRGLSYRRRLKTWTGVPLIQQRSRGCTRPARKTRRPGAWVNLVRETTTRAGAASARGPRGGPRGLNDEDDDGRVAPHRGHPPSGRLRAAGAGTTQ